MIYKFFNALSGSYAGRECRRCAEPIDRRDGFAQSEGVCRPCAA